MLDSELRSAVEKEQDPSDGGQKISDTNLSFPHQISTETLHINGRSLPCTISQTHCLNGHVRDARTEGAAHPKSANEHGIISQAILPTNTHHVTTASKTHPSNLSSNFDIEFTASVDDNGQIVPNHFRKNCNGILESCQMYSSQNGQSIPPNWISPAAGNRCASDFTRLKSPRTTRMLGDPLCSSVVGLVSQMSHDDGYNEFKRLLSEQRNGRTCTAGAPGYDSVTGWAHSHISKSTMSDATVTSDGGFSEASLTAEQVASNCSTVFGDWREDFDVAVGEGGCCARSSVESDTWPSTFTDSDDALTFAQQNSDEFPSWK